MSRVIVVVLAVLCFPARADGIGELRKGLAAKAWSKRWHAVCALGDAGSRARAAVPDLIAVFEGADPLLSRESALALSRIAPDSDAVVGALVKSLDRKGIDHGTVLGALEASGKKAIGALPWLVRRLKASRIDPHRRDLKLLAAIDPPLAVYVGLLETKSGLVRAEVIAELRIQGSKAREAIPGVCQWLGDEDEALRNDARTTLKAIGADSLCRAIPFTKRTTQTWVGGVTKGPVVTWGPTLSLVRLRERSLVELIGILEDKTIGLKTRRQLARVQLTPRDRRKLVQMVRLANAGDHVVHCAVLLLPLFADDLRAAKKALGNALNHSSPAVRRAAREALASTRHRNNPPARGR